MSKRKQTGEEMRSRLREMCREGQQTWDLSANDVEALFHVTTLIDELAVEVAHHTGRKIGDVIDEASRAIEARVGQ